MPESLPIEIQLNVRYAKLAPRFVEMQREELPEIQAALEAADFPALNRFGHNLKGTGPSYGLGPLGPIGEKLESAGAAKDRTGAETAVAELAEFLDKVHISYRNSILFVDDEPEFRALLQRLFDTGEYICHFAPGGREALQVLDKEQIDVVVSDLAMPDMGGLELLSLVRQKFPRMVRLVLSGQAEVPAILEAINSGQVFRYVTKPWKVDAEARASIAEAVAYANELNNYEPTSLNLPVETITHILAVCGSPYVLLGKEGKLVASSAPWAVKWPEGKDASQEELTAAGIETIALDRMHVLRVARD
jgi:CheY-like chemotaxis protein